MRSQPELKLAIAWGMGLAMRFDEALERVDEIERHIGPNQSRDSEALRCECKGHPLGGDRAQRRQRGGTIDRARLSQPVGGPVDRERFERRSLWLLEDRRSQEVLRDAMDSVFAR